MFKAQFVTAIYSGLEGTRLNGNTAAIYDRYIQSLKSLADGGYSIVCYTSSRHYDDLVKYFTSTPNLKVVSEELESNYYHADIDKIKGVDPKYTTEAAWRSRCVEIMWGKFIWLWKNVSELDDTDSIFWIDAGLFHGGLITNKFRSEASKNFYDFDMITQHRDLYNDLCNYVGDKVLNIRSKQVNHGSDDFQKVYGYRPEFGVIGGMFGGKRDQVLSYIAEAFHHMQRVVDNGVLLKEEEIMYHLHQAHPDNFTQFSFNTWYHEDWEQMYRPGEDVSFSDFFKVLHG
ncbi:hypothetical protein Xoosp13_302 [Xanthomonas phage Xoo-sp13]|nr:hypothetical protein Xoosp13_302 [Xanthomonas phage Xoo-sp13]